MTFFVLTNHDIHYMVKNTNTKLLSGQKFNLTKVLRVHKFRDDSEQKQVSEK